MRFPSSYLPATRTGRILGFGIGVSAAGSGAFLGSSVLYFVGMVGFSATQVGLALSIAALCGIVSPVPIGRLADRVDPARIYLVLVILRGLVYAGFVFVGHYPIYLVLTCVATAMDRACSPLQQLVVAGVEGDSQRTRSLASINALRNAGASAGFLLAGLVLGLGTGVTGFRALFLFNAATFFVIAASLRNVCTAGAPGTPHSAQPATPRPVAATTARGPFRDLRYLALAAGNGVMNVYHSVLLVLLPAWIAVTRELPGIVAPLMLGLNAILAIVTQPPAARTVRGWIRARQVIMLAAALLVFAVTSLTGAVVVDLPVFLVIGLIAVAVVSFTLGESFQSVAAYELSFEMAVPERRGQYVALFHASMYAQQVFGPILMTALLLPAGPGWLVLAPVFVIGAGAMWWGSAGGAAAANRRI